MAELFESLASLDKLIHEPARLAILTALSACESADFLYLQRLTGLSKGNLSSHLSKLEKGGLIQIDKTYMGKKPSTLISLTENGRGAIEAHWQQLAELRQDAQNWRPAVQV